MERCHDIKERDAFEERLKEKDKEKTRKIVERSNRKVSFVEIYVIALLLSLLILIMNYF